MALCLWFLLFSVCVLTQFKYVEIYIHVLFFDLYLVKSIYYILCLKHAPSVGLSMNGEMEQNHFFTLIETMVLV